MEKSDLISELIEEQVQLPIQIRSISFNKEKDGVNIELADVNIAACSCYQSCGSNFSRNGECSCYTSCGSNYSH